MCIYRIVSLNYNMLIWKHFLLLILKTGFLSIGKLVLNIFLWKLLFYYYYYYYHHQYKEQQILIFIVTFD